MTATDDTVQQLRQVLVENFASRFPVTRSSPQTPLFAGGLELDSFAVVELIALLEQRFQLQFREEDFREEYFRNSETLATLIDRYRQEQASRR